MNDGVIAEDIIAELEQVESGIRELEALTEGTMHGERVWPDPRHYQSLYAILAWLKDTCGERHASAKGGRDGDGMARGVPVPELRGLDRGGR